MPEVVANGVRLFYQQTGSGPDVVLVHAVTSNLAVWLFSGLADALAADFRVTLYDLRGHGASERPPERTKILEGAVGPFGRGWLRQLPKLAETTCGEEALAEAGLTADRIAAVTRPVAALYDEFSPFLATGRWLERNLPHCTADII